MTKTFKIMGLSWLRELSNEDLESELKDDLPRAGNNISGGALTFPDNSPHFWEEWIKLDRKEIKRRELVC